MSPEIEKPNVTHLKDDIDSGRTGDKIAGFDPGAAPLGTDDEAGGASLTPEAVALAREQERAAGGSSARRNAAEPTLQPDGAGSSGPRLAPALLGVAAGVLLIVAVVALLL